MLISIHHQLSLDPGTGAGRAVQHLLLTPQSSHVQTIREWHIDMPGIDEAPGFFDAFGNRAHVAAQAPPAARLTITATGVVETHDRSGVLGRPEREPVPALFRRMTALTEPLPALVSAFRETPASGRERLALLHALMARVAELLEPAEPAQSQKQGAQRQVQAGDAAAGSASDHAHAFVGAARALGIPARYVTGYWCGEAPEEGHFHAWAEAFDDGLGWIGFDAMLGLCPTERHVRLACGLDAQSAVPVRAYPPGGLLEQRELRLEILDG